MSRIAAHSAPVVRHSWSQVWQLPLLVLGAGLFAAGVYLAMDEGEPYDFGSGLDNVAYYLEAGNLDEAETQLKRIAEHLQEAEEPTDANVARFHQYLADLNFLQLQEQVHVPVDTKLSRQTNQRIASHYAKAQELAGLVAGKSTRRYAETLVALGRDDEALGLVDQLEHEAAHRRYGIVRTLIDKQRARPDDNGIAAVTPLVERFRRELRTETDAERRREQSVWVTALEAELQLEAGDPQRAIDFLLRKLQRFTSQGGDSDLAPLLVLLAQAYQKTADFDNAQRLYHYAQQKLESNSGLNAQILLGLGQIALHSSPQGQGESNLHQALEHFTIAVRNYPSEQPYVEAMIGRADCEARLGAYPESVDHFGEAVGQLVSTSATWDPRREAVTDVVRAHINRALDQGEFELALDYLTLLVPLHEPNVPADMLLDFAVIHESIADQRKNHADQLTLRLRREEPGVSLDARRLANQEAAMNYEEAGDFYVRHARAITILDDDSHGMSLWKAAACYDRAQHWGKAIDVYAEFIKTRQNDARRLAAMHQLGKAYMADGQYGPAAELFLQLVEQHPHSPEAYDSLVPLARAQMGQDRPDAAERGLLQVVTDHPAITPDSSQYQQALIELGRLYYRLGEVDGNSYVKAIERLEEAVTRYGLSDQGPTLRYLLADSYRKSVAELDRRLQAEQAQSERLALQSERTRRLEQAQMYYSQVVNELESKPTLFVTPLEELYHRNAYFYQADCAFDRGQYETAIQLYDDAARRWDKHPAALVAMVQIVNAHCELGQYQEAKVANSTARWLLERMPEEAFEDETLPMSRQHWEDWLRWTSELDLFETQASAD